MKKLFILTALILVSSIFAFSQTADSTAGDPNITSYGEPVPNTVPTFALEKASLPTAISQYLDQKLTAYSAYNFNYSLLNAYLVGNPHALEFNLDSTFLSLQRRDIRAPQFTQSVTGEDGSIRTLYTQDLVNDSLYEVHTLKGFADHSKSKVVRLSIEGSRLTGYIWNTETNQVFYYTTLQDFIKDNGDSLFTNENSLLVFDLGAVRGVPNAKCGAIESAVNSQPKGTGSFMECSPRFLTIAAEGDYYWCQAYGSFASAKILENLFFVEGIYTVNFNIAFIVSNINLLPGSPNIYNKTNAYQRLFDFQNNWNANHTSIPRDITLLYSGIYSDTLGAAYVGSISCSSNMSAYGIVCRNNKLTLVTAHEMGHIFGSQHDDYDYDQFGNIIGGYGTSSCSGSDVPIMCSRAVSDAPNPDYYFSSHTRSIILSSASSHSACLSDYWNGSPINTVLKSWSNFQNKRWIATWLMQNKDIQVAGNFDGTDNDEEIFFAAPDNKWAGIMDFSCDQGTDWYHMWGNSGNGQFGTWIRNSGDKYMAGDFDGNGKSDLFSVSGSAYWSALQEYDPSNWSWVHKWGNSGSRWIASWQLSKNDTYVIGDFDGDGKDELFCVNPNGWAQLIKFNWVAVGGGGYYNPQTIWSNSGSGYFEGQLISSIQRWYKGKMKNTTRDEIFTIGNNFTGVVRFDGTYWKFITGEGITTSFTTPNTTPAHVSFRFMGTGNIDNDPYDEYVAISQQWVGTQDYSGGGLGMNHNWNNGGTSYLTDWNLNTDVDYMLVKAASNSPKQILGRKSEKRTSGGWFWYSEWWEPTLAGMYRTNAPIQNFRLAPNSNNPKSPQESTTTVYPNPTSGVINISLGAGIESAEVVVIDVLGRQVAKQTVTPENNTISLANCSAGTYVIRTTLPDQSIFTSKIVVYER